VTQRQAQEHDIALLVVEDNAKSRYIDAPPSRKTARVPENTGPTSVIYMPRATISRTRPQATAKPIDNRPEGGKSGLW
jgi:hypothetical protein